MTGDEKEVPFWLVTAMMLVGLVLVLAGHDLVQALAGWGNLLGYALMTAGLLLVIRSVRHDERWRTRDRMAAEQALRRVSDEPLTEGDRALLRVEVARANREQAFIGFTSMEGPYSIRVPLSELRRDPSVLPDWNIDYYPSDSYRRQD